MRSIFANLSAVLLLYTCFAAISHGTVDRETCMTALGVPAGDCDALVALYTSTNGDSWTDNTNWGIDIAPWFGVTVSGARVAEIELFSNYLTGSIPPELGNLNNLARLWLYSNQLAGPIPSELGNLINLGELFLTGNQLTGPIPAELGNLSNLTWLILDNNQLEGPIPAELGNLSGLTDLLLNRNQLTGPIPAELGNLSNLRGLYLFTNWLTGPIPAELGNLGNLEYLKLSWNHLTGPIPPELGNLVNLKHLDLDWNQITGPIPAELGNLLKLEVLDLMGNLLTGPIPVELGNLSILDWLYLNNNHLDADADGNALIPEEIQAWYDGITHKRISNQMPFFDTDNDGIQDSVDNCTIVPNPAQRDTDFDGYGNCCDADLDNNCIVNFVDLGIMKSVFFQTPSDGFWNPHADLNSDGSINFIDLGIMKSSFFLPPGPSEISNLCDPIDPNDPGLSPSMCGP